jgi:CheY-like chemotaxis protein
MSLTVSNQSLIGWKILVVDDEPDSLEVAQILLSMRGGEVITASTGREGLELARLNLPHFILADLSMPDMSGWEMLDSLKDDPSTAQIPVFALTAHVMRGDRKRALDAGFDNHLSKPLKPETFVSDLIELLRDIPALSDRLLVVADSGGN